MSRCVYEMLFNLVRACDWYGEMFRNLTFSGHTVAYCN